MVRQQLVWETKGNFSAHVYILILFVIPFPYQPTVKQKKGLQCLMLKESSKAFRKQKRFCSQKYFLYLRVSIKKMFYSKKWNTQRNQSRENSLTIIKWLHHSVDGKIHKWIPFCYLNFSSSKNKQTLLHEAWIVLRPPESFRALNGSQTGSLLSLSLELCAGVSDRSKMQLTGSSILSIHDCLSHRATFFDCCQL